MTGRLFSYDEAEKWATKLDMAMKEGGYVGEAYAWLDAPTGMYVIRWYASVFSSTRAPDDAMWRAREAVAFDDPCCFKHYMGRDECLAEHRFMKDCQGGLPC